MKYNDDCSIHREWKRGVVMKKLLKLLPIALFTLFVPIAYSQSLGDLAKKEKERRESVKNDRVITDEEIAKYIGKSETTKDASDKAPIQPDNQGSKENKKDSAAKPENETGDEAVDFQGRPESYWRNTMSAAYENAAKLENESNALVLKLNTLQDQFYKEADGFRRETVQREIQKTYYEQDLNKQNLEKAKAALQDLENEARKSGALPGWIERK
jgi:hypothetical protein